MCENDLALQVNWLYKKNGDISTIEADKFAISIRRDGGFQLSLRERNSNDIKSPK